ncbi:malectin domain-containing carbohydrate-binding protein [Vreelandella titanicae]|uniref:malectin domain-containing carbohydrate-binding protein n=2 Tax=Vreelandella titanicae TaxID=664683 RepID=UPI001EEECA23|nr:malectin domain-containing carbohydrate-binding protein [Halomonas titanicae]
MSQPTALVWGADGRLYITEQSGDVKVLTVAFGDPNTADSDSTASFYVVEAETVFLVKELPNHNDDGTEGGSNNRQVTGIDVTPQYDENGDPVIINGKPAVNIYVTSSDNRIGAGSSGSDTGLDTNSGIITRLTQTVDGWEALDLVRGLARSEENHSLNGLEVIQEFDDNGRLLSERLIVANGGNANAGAPSNNFSGQQETAYSAAILEVDLDQLKSMEIKNDDGRNYVYDIPTLNAPSRSPSEEALTDPFGGNDGFNGGKIDPNGPVQIYSAGYRNAYDVEVTEDGRVWTYDNGANNSWGGRPVGEAGDNGGNIDAEQDENYIATNLNNGDGSGSDSINTEAWNPKNLDQFHEITRSDDLAGRVLSAGQAGAATYVMAHPDFDDPLTLVYGGHPNPTRASGGEAGLLFTPKNGVEDAFLLVSEEHYDSVIDWLVTVEGESNGVSSGDLTSRVISLAPGELYYITENGEAYLTSDYTQTPSSIGGSDVLGTAGVPADIDDVVATLNAIEGNYLEGGYNDGAIDSGTGSINGLTEYTSTVFDDGETKMSGALMAVQLGGGNLIVMGRDENGVMQTASGSGGVKAAERITLTLSGSPLGLASIGDDLSAWDNQAAFRGSVWATVYSGSGTKIEILQPNNGAVPLAGSEAADPTDHDLDGINHIHDPFEYSAANGLALTPGEAIVMNFQPTEAPYPGTIGDTGLMGAALDGTTPNQDANPDQGLPGLYDIGGNIIPGANAALFQIKEVVPGTVVGPVNSVRDAMHVGVNPSSDVQRLVATTQVLNWIADNGSVEDGQLTGLMFGDGTQANFVRLVFGEVNGEAGFEVGYEINDNNYLALAQVAVPGLTDTAVTQVELYLEIDMADGFALYASYRLNSEDAFTELPLNGFTLPEGVLRDVLTGNHTISDGDSQASSGAAFGFLAETSEGAPLAPVNFENLKINGFGNEIEADSAGGVGAEGSNGIDTIIYTGTDTVLSPLDDSVENFDGSGTMADFHATGNGGDNVMIAGSGNNTFTGGGGADSFQGTLDTINGTEITDFTPDDEVVVQGASFDASDVTYQAGSAIITINNETAITFSGEGFDDFDPSTGESVFSFTSTANGTRITTVPALTAVAAISSGGPDINNVTVRDQTIDFLSDMTNAEVNGWVSGVTSKDYVNVVDIDGSVPDELHQSERSAEDAGEWGYSIPVENGEYLIDMYFAEIYHGVENSSGTGARVFDISIEDALVEDDYDIIGDVGSAATEVIKTYAVTVTDGVLNIGFDASVNQAKISGLVVWQVGGTYVPPEDVTPPEVVSIMIDQPFDNDSDILATVVVTDNAGINVDSINGDELIFTGYEPGAVSLADNDAITLSNDGKTATIQYTISPPTGSNAWENGAFKVGVAAGSFTDTTGLGIAAFETDVIIARNLEQLVKGALQRAINVGPTSNTIDNSLEGDDKNTYGGAITNDPILGIDLEADDPAYYSPSTKTGSNIDGKAGATGSNSGGVDLDGSAYHTYRDSAAGSYTATYEVPNGLYVVELHFAELYQTQGGQRQGDYTIQGELFAENFDAFIAAGGADKPTVLTKNVIVTDGKIVIDVNADNGEPGFNAIAIYQAVDSGIPIASILSIEAPESSDGQVIVTVQYTDDGNISGTQIGATDVTVSSAAGALVTPSLVAYDSASGIATYIFDAPESGWQTGTITASVAANAVLDSDNNGNSATASSVYVNYSSDGVILELDFENPGSPLEEGGFDGTLGDVVDDTVFTTVEGGELVVWTSNGDISQAAAPSANDFIKYVALGDPALETINITSRFDNPFPAALAAQELPTDIVPNYAQQGIVFGLGSQGNNELVKLVFGGNGGNGVQIWSKSAIDTVIPLASMLSNASTTLNDIASVELTLVVNKTAGTVTPIVTFFDTNENVLGGLRAEATEGFATASPEVLPPAVLSNLTDPNSTTAVGVTSTDYNDPIESFMASWDYLNVTSPDLISEPTDPTTTLAIVNAPDIIENGDDGFTTLNFGLTASDGFSGEVELTLSIDGAAVTDTLNFSDGTAILSVDVPNDDVANGTNEISVTLVAVNSTGLFEIDASAATATGSVTEDDEGSVPNPDDLDEDGVSNDDDLFPYDAANGMILAAGETFLLDFEEDTASPYEAGLTGLMGRANESNSAGAVESGTASVENGTLNIVADTGDHYTNNNSQKDAYAVGVKNPGGFIVETSFTMPDFDDQQEGLQAPLNYQAGGVAVSLSEDNLVKWIFGANGTAAFQLAHENKQVEGATPAVPGATFALPSGVVYSDIASVKLMLEIVVDTTSGEVTALTRSVLTLNNTNIIDGASGEITLTDPLASAIKDEAQGVSVGFIQTSTGGQSPDTFDISYDYLQVSSTEEATPQVLVGITDAGPVVENGDEGSTTLSFGLTASESFSGEVALDLTINGTSEPRTVVFTGGVGSLTVDVANDDQANGPEQVSVILAGTADEAFAIDPAAATATGTVAEDDVGQTVIGITDADSMVENGDEGTTTLSFGLTASEGFSGEVALSVDIDGVVEPRTVVFTGGVGSLTVDVANDDQANGPEQVSVILAGIAGEAFAIDPAAATATGTVTEDDEVAPTTPVRLQAEDFTAATNYTVENIGAADEGQGIRLQGGESGTASYVLAGAVAAGTYTVIVGYFDENDGESTAQLSIGNAQGQSFSGDWIFDNDASSGNAAQAASFRTVTFENVTVGDDATLDLASTAAPFEYARIDYIEFVPAGIVEPPAPTLIGITDADSMVENGDEGTTTLSFGLTASEGFSGEVALSVDIDGVVEPRTVVFTGGVGSLTVDVANDDQANGPEQVSVILAGIAGEAFAIDPAAATATGTVTEDDEVAPTTPVRLQAEDFTAATNYTVENIGAADEGQGIRLQGGESGTASYVLAGAVAAGTYTVIVGYFDENDGESTAQLSIGNAQGQSFSGDWIFDNDASSGNAAQAASFRTVTFENVTVGDDATLDLASTAAPFEYARIDYIEFVPAGIVEPPAPTLIGITDADSMVENGDEGTTTLSFGLTASEGFSGEVALSVDIDGVVEPRTVVFTGGVGSLTVDVANDDQANGPEQVSVILAGIADEAFAIDPSAATATGTVTEDDEVAPTTPVRLQTEDFTTATNYTVENIGAADEGQGIRLQGGESGTASYALAGAVAAGTYTVIVGYFDENDGESTAQLSIGNAQGQSFSGDWIFDNDATSGNAAQAASFRTVTFENVTVGDDATLDLASTAAPFEYARIDYIEFVPAGIVEPPAPTLIGISNADPMVENGDEGSTTLSFGLTASEGFSGEVALDLTINGTSEPRTVVFTGGIGSLTVDVANDDQANGPEQVSVILAGIADEAFAIDPAAATATGTVTEDDDVAPTTPVRLQAEDFTTATNYTVENIGAADEGQGIRLQGGESGTASYALAGAVAAGTYTVIVGYFDENDGESTAQLSIGNAQGQSFSGDWIFDNDATSGNAAQASSFRTVTFENVTVGDDATLALSATAATLEYARIDYIEFVPAGIVEPPAPTLIGISDADPMVESGDEGATTLSFGLTASEGFSGEVALDLTINGTSEPRTVVFTGGVGSLTVDVANDDQANGPEQVSVILNGIADEAFAIDPAAATATGTVTEDDEVAPTTPVRLQAEDFTTATNYTVENIGAADEGQGIRLQGGESGTASYALAGAVAAGTYTVIVGYFDENDGESTAQLSIGNAQGQSFSGDWIFDNDATSGNAAQAASFRTVTFENVTVGDDATLALSATAATLEYARIDYIEFVPAGIVEPPAPTLIGISDADPMVESGDEGATTLSFGLTASEGFSGEVALDLTINGTSEPRTVVFTGGVGSLTVDVANDDQANGPEQVSVILAGIADEAFAIDPAAATAMGTVTEDDITSTDPATINLEFDEGETLQGLFDGVTEGSGTDTEETGTAEIINGNLVISASEGDAGGSNNANDNYYTNVSGGDGFTAELKFGNPFPSLPAQYSQLGLNISLSQDEYLKVTFGNVGGGQIEYSYELGGSQSKQTFSLPPSISFAQIADVVVAIEASVDGGMASFSGTMTFLDASGQSLGDTALPALLLPDGPLNTAITSAGEEFGVGVTQTSFGSGPVFVANYDYLRIQQQGEESTDDNDKPVATIAILQPVNTDAELTVVVTYADASGIATETLDNSDIALMLDGVPVAATISFDGFNATTGEATYAISSPAGGWNENGSYTVWVAQGAVSDASENANLVDSTPSTSFMIDFDEGSPLGGYAPGDDLDEDGTANQADEDIDGDGDANVDDVFAYDAQNGQPLADGESIRLNFEVNGTPYQNGFTGVMASSDVAFQDEDTGAGIVADNQLRVTTTSGDTGSANTPQNDYHLGIIRDGGFILESVVDNPFASAPGSYSQLGLAVSVNSNDFAKLVFGSVGQDIEFSSRDNNAETKLGADFPDGYGFGDFAKAKLVLDVSVNNVGNTMATATVTLLDASGEPLPGNASVTISGLELTGALKEAILDPAASVGVGITHTHGAAEAFTAAYDYFEVSAKEDTSTPLPVPATEIEEIFAGANLELSDSYDQGDVGSALVTVTPGGNDVQSSNYGSNSFQVQNTGDKKIAAVFFDVTTALYGDSVFDPDGKGGDATAKEWAINSAGNTGAIQPVGSSGYEHYFLPGIDPEPENSDNNGGYRGALVKFSATANGGFTNGETVGFSGDMDPNSIAGFTKSSVDTGSIPFWDVGGISGAELIGSNVYIKFTDGSTASGQLMSDGSQAGAQVLVSETPPNLVAELSVNGLSAGSQGTYGGEVPSVIVSGPAGEWVRVVMTKGHQPVTNNQDGIADTVNARLADKNFPANNAAEFQFVDVQLGASGTADVSQEFTYGDFLNDTSSFDGDDTLPLGFVASVIDNPNTSDGLGLGPVSQPIYLISNGTPVVDGDTTIPSEGYYLMEGSRLKVQFEDINGPGGVNPPGKWQFFDEADENGNQANFQGVGYYLWGDEDSEALNGPQAELTYTFVIPESAAGEFTLRVRGTRDPGGASDAQNDVWVKIDDNAEELLVSNVNAIDNSGFIKLYGNATGDFGFANFIDSTSDSVPNFPAEFVLDAGVHTITFAGRSEGFHIDFFELYQGNAPSINATNSTFILSGDTEPFVNNPLENQTIEAEDEFFFEIPDDTFRDLDGDILTYEALNIPDGVFFDAQTKTFSGSPSAGVGNYALEVQVTDEDGATATAGFDLVVVPEDQNEPDTYFVAMVESANGDIEQGSSLSSPDLEIGSYVVGIQFTVPDNINLDDSETIDSAIISWVSDRTHSANSTMTFSVENSLNGAGFGSVTNRNYLSEEEVWQATGTWQDGENITVGINLANQLNSLIAQEGLNSGDLITVKIEGTGGTRFVEAAGGDRTAPTLAITVADNASASQLSNNATLLFESNSISDMSADDEFGTLNPSSMSQEVGLVGINDESTVGSF